jgi:hypothetical protein
VSEFRDESLDDWCKTCDRPILKDQPYTFDGGVLRHAVCYDEDMRSKD